MIFMLVNAASHKRRKPRTLAWEPLKPYKDSHHPLVVWGFTTVQRLPPTQEHEPGVRLTLWPLVFDRWVTLCVRCHRKPETSQGVKQQKCDGVVGPRTKSTRNDWMDFPPGLCLFQIFEESTIMIWRCFRWYLRGLSNEDHFLNQK